VTALSLDIRALARALGGDVAGRDRVLVPGPGHSRKDRSLSVTLNRGAPEGFVVHSFAGDDPLACRDHVRSRAELPAWSPNSDRMTAPAVVRDPRPVSREEKRRAEWRRTRVLATWESARNPLGTIVEAYLAGRNLRLSEDVAGAALRFHPACPWTGEDGSTIKVPAMVAAMRDIHTNELKAIHRTRLTADGKKVDRRMFGEVVGTAIKLDPDDAVTIGLVIAEGIETAMAARQLGFRSTWALGSVGAVAKFPVLSGVEGLSLAAEDDKTGANARALDECGNRWHAAGRTVIVLGSKFGGDINDALNHGRAA
jgi:putative DNA primase/helicase